MCRVHTRCVILGSFTRGWSWENHLATLPLKCELGFESRSVSLCDEIMAGNGFREIHKPRELVFFFRQEMPTRCANIATRESQYGFFFCSFLFCFVFNFRINEIRTLCRIDIRFISLLFGSLGQEKFFFFFFSFFTPFLCALSRNALSDTTGATARNLARRLHTGARARIYTRRRASVSPALNYYS